MEIIRELSNQYVLYIPCALVMVGAILVFTFGFKSAEQPPSFDKLSSEDRKAAGKKRKIKEKKSTANGHVSTGETKHDKSPAKDHKKSPNKEVIEPKQEKKEKKSDNKQVDKNKKNDIIKSNVLEESKNKKNLKKAIVKPADFDEGDWETVPLKSDKKKKTDSQADQSPVKKEKKAKKVPYKVDKVEIEKLVKEVVNKELREMEKDIKEEIVIEKIVKKEEKVVDEPVVVVEEKKEKKKEKKIKKEVVEEPVAPPMELENEPVQKETVKDEKKTEKAEVLPSAKTQPKEVAPVFDELGDMWTQAKAAKKSKKKARRDN